MTVPPIGATPPTPPTPPAGGATTTPGTDTGFGDAIQRGLQQVSDLEHTADATVQQVATGGATVHELMTATAKAQLGVELLGRVRDQALEAYHEIMRLQV